MNKKKSSIKLLRYTLIVCVSLIYLSLISTVFAKYILTTNGSSSAIVACFTPSFTSTKIDIVGINKPGDDDFCNLKVQNYTEDMISDVAVSYKIIINTTGNLPLTFTILDSSENVLSVWDCDGQSGNKKYVYESSNIFIPNVFQFCEYTIKIEWKEERNDAQFSGMTDAVYVSIEWGQVD